MTRFPERVPVSLPSSLVRRRPDILAAEADLHAATAAIGVRLADHDDSVNAILVELSQRHTQDQSDEFASLILREGQGLLAFHPQARRSAALVVLRAPDVPSALFEAGFISNQAEANQLASPEGREQFAQVLARAIRIYFARRSDAS